MTTFQPKHRLIKQDVAFGGRYSVRSSRFEKETHSYGSFEVATQKPSAFADGLTVRFVEGFKCPSCKTLLPGMDHGDFCQCGECGLQMQLFGNGLSIWREGS